MRRLSSDECIIGKIPKLSDFEVKNFINIIYNIFRSILFSMTGTQIKTTKYLGKNSGKV